MQRKFGMRFTVVIWISTIGLVGVGCGGDPEPETSGTAAPAIEVAAQVPPFILVDQHGDSFDSESLYGKLWVAQFVSADCTEACPQAILRLGELRGGLTAEEAAEIVWVSFVVDGDPSSLQQLVGEGADAPSWSFLSGRPNQIRQLLRNGFGVTEGHSHDFVLVGRLGENLGRYEDVGALKAEIQQRAAIPAAQIVPFPEEVLETPWLEGRGLRQLATKADFGVFNDFRFDDRAP